MDCDSRQSFLRWRELGGLITTPAARSRELPEGFFGNPISPAYTSTSRNPIPSDSPRQPEGCLFFRS